MPKRNLMCEEYGNYFLDSNPFFDAHQDLFGEVKLLSKKHKQTPTFPKLIPIIDICERIEKNGKDEWNMKLLLNSIQKCIVETKKDVSIAEEIIYILHIFNIDNIYI